MLKSRRPILCGLLAGGIFFLSGCRKSTETGTTSTPQATPNPDQAALQSKERHHRIFTGGVSPLIVSMTPDTIRVHNGHAPVTRYSLTYEINNAEKASKAYIIVYARGLGQIQRRDVDVQPSGQIEFLLDASEFDLGPMVRFRVHCPGNDTDWFAMGSEPLEPSQRLTSQQIGNVTPAYVAQGTYRQGMAIPITIWGGQITPECTAEAQVDGTTVELKNVVASDKKIHGGLSDSDFQRRPIVVRHFEVNLVVEGPGMPAADVYNLDFVE